MQVKTTPLGLRLLNFAYRVPNRLQFFPLTLLFVLIGAVVRAIKLRLGYGFVRVGEATVVEGSLPRNVMWWLNRALAGSPDQQYDVCLRLPKNDVSHSLHDVFSVLMTFPGSRSIFLYWDSPSLVDDLPLLKAKQDRNVPADSAKPHEDLDSFGIPQLEQFLESGRAKLALPVAAIRDAQTLLKRRARARRAVCLNIPVESSRLMGAVSGSLPDTYFFRFTSQPPPNDAPNIDSFFDCGFTLHERMALIRAADAYVGEFDELGCTALISGRPSFLVCTGEQRHQFNAGAIAVWFPSSMDDTRLSNALLQFLSHHLVSEKK